MSVVDEEHISTDERRIFNGRSSLRMEECAKSMGQRSNYAAMRDAQIKFKVEECARGMGQRSNDAAAKDVRIKWYVEGCA